jgi:nucleotide-binding universal stress UspA family protein
VSGRIVVGVDGSKDARNALAWALDEARMRGASVEVVHAWRLPSLVVAGPFGAAPIVDEDTIDRVQRAAEHLLEEELQAVSTEGVEVEPIAPRASPANALMDIARGAELLVVGSRGHGGFAGLLLGSVSQQVSHHAPCPVVIVPRRTTDDR